MPVIEIGRVCVKNSGRCAGNYCVITKLIDDNFVEITGPKAVSGIKRKRCNLKHIEITDKTISIKENASDEDIAKAVDDAKLTDVMKKGI